MLDVARNRTYPSSPDDLPAWMRDLPGFPSVTDQMVDRAGMDRTADWEASMRLPADWAESADTDSLVVLVGLAFGAARVEEKLTEVVSVCRQQGKSWTQIGEALGMTKQSAWARFSGED